ncbi:MAG: ribosome recycling factor [Cyanobacteria bacterium HKST-UBA05]|nr:ribosome recycling factor [Cyanobacteria bacterium HKST-UBA05]
MPTLEEIQTDAEARMQKAITSTQSELSSIRTGRANPQLLDRVSVDYYGAPTPVHQLANVSTPDGQTILIQPYDKSAIPAIEKAIAQSELGLTPNNDGSNVRLTVPPLTEERRKEVVKLTKKYGEDGKVAVRNIRRDAQDSIKKLEKEEKMPEDVIKGELEDLQKLTDKYVHQLDSLVDNKEKELMTI